MTSTSFSAAIRSVMDQADDAPPPLRLRSLVWRSALLNLAVALTALPVLLLAGGQRAIAPALAVLAAVSLLIWATTISAFFLVSLARGLWCLGVRRSRHPHRRSDGGGGLTDEWLDDPA